MQEYNKTAGGKTKDKWQKNDWIKRYQGVVFKKMKWF